MKDKKFISLGLSLIALIFIYVGTYSYYRRVINGSINGKAGAFTFDVLHNDTSFTTIDLYDTIVGTPSVTDARVIIPGDSGEFTLTAKGTGSSTDIEYSIVFNGSRVPTNMVFYLDKNKTQVLDVQTNAINGYLKLSSSMVKDHTIYWEWPYDSGEYNDLDSEFMNTSISIGVSIVGKQSDGMLVYGVSRDTNSSSTSWTRVENSVGLEANAVMPDSGTTTVSSQGPGINLNVKNDFDNIYPWSEIRSYNYDANLKKVTAWYGDSNFTFDGSNGEVLTYIPCFWYKREVINGTEYQYISKYEQEGYSYSESFSVSRYKISRAPSVSQTKNDSKGNLDLMISLPGGNSVDRNLFDIFTENISSRSDAKPLTNNQISFYREFASKLGNEFSIMDYHYFILQMLYLVEYADYDVQAKLGLGAVGSDGATSMGGTDNLGMKSGCVYNDGTGSSIYRGMEDLYGYTFEFVDGINIMDYKAYINYDFRTYKEDVFDGDYKPLGYVNSNVDLGWVTKIGYDSNNSLIGLPISVDATNTDTDVPSGIMDSYNSYAETNLLIVGGAFGSNSSAGLWSFDCGQEIYYSIPQVGARLIRHQTAHGRDANLSMFIGS